MPPKFKRHLEPDDVTGARIHEATSLLGADGADGEDDDEGDEDFFLSGPSKHSPMSKTSSKLHSVKSEVDGVMGIMKENMVKLFERGDRLDDLQDKSDQLTSSSDIFRMSAQDLKKQMWWRECKMRLILIAVIVIIMLVIILPIIIQATKKS
ncbi:PREDICTED: vesicle-associated membrane protein 4-like [Priapulus caudatus]|uniref:Vesicle-associated membrane protein 4-like n=1 Tax=Priapulus caudatus TaxID=37621 RepID=A0ABM1DY06_PRICU|nr:PREDICTED: vesicle-associated membrane protein 4-like [Priapulus caudatus]